GSQGLGDLRERTRSVRIQALCLSEVCREELSGNYKRDRRQELIEVRRQANAARRHCRDLVVVGDGEGIGPQLLKPLQKVDIALLGDPLRTEEYQRESAFDYRERAVKEVSR